MKITFGMCLRTPGCCNDFSFRRLRDAPYHHSTTVFFDALICEVGWHSSDRRFFHALLAFPASGVSFVKGHGLVVVTSLLTMVCILISLFRWHNIFPCAICMSNEIHVLYNRLYNGIWFISCFCSPLSDLASWLTGLTGTQIGLGLGHIVSDGDLVSLPKGTQPPIFGPYLLCPNGSDQDATW